MNTSDLKELRLDISRLLKSKTITKRDRQKYCIEMSEDIDDLIRDQKEIIKQLEEQKERVLRNSVKLQKIIWEKYDRITNKSSGKSGQVISYKAYTDEVSVRIGDSYYKWVGLKCDRTVLCQGFKNKINYDAKVLRGVL